MLNPNFSIKPDRIVTGATFAGAVTTIEIPENRLESSNPKPLVNFCCHLHCSDKKQTKINNKFRANSQGIPTTTTVSVSISVSVSVCDCATDNLLHARWKESTERVCRPTIN